MQSDHFPFSTVLQNMGIAALNDMQKATLEAARQHNDLVLISPTGTGKTLAFLLPVLPGLETGKGHVQAVVITPTRELALQIGTVFKEMKTPHKTTLCYGGHPIRLEESSLTEPPALLIGTPGRLADHLQRGNLDLSKVKWLVLDEFDKSLEMGFQEEMAFILRHLTNLQNRLLTSATDLPEIPGFTGIENPHRLHFGTQKSAAKKLETWLVRSPEKDKLGTLHQLICNLGPANMIVFCNHRDAVERVSGFLFENDIPHDYYHGGLEQNEREKTLSKFRNGTVRILVSTDLAARGLDIPGIEHIVHYHLPTTADAYTHRNGRTARMDAKGSAFLLLHDEEDIPDFVEGDPPVFYLKNLPPPPHPDWETLFIGKGKKDKINKVDIVGFLSKTGGLQKEEIGLIEVKDLFAYVAVKRELAKMVLGKIQNQKIKGIKAKIEMAR